MEIYVHDMVIKREREETFISDINETFCKIREVNMNLSPAKCTFGVEDGNFLGYIVSNKGIQENPEKVEAPATMKPPITLKEIQGLNGKLASLGRFLAMSAEKLLPFFKTLKGCIDKKDLCWIH